MSPDSSLSAVTRVQPGAAGFGQDQVVFNIVWTGGVFNRSGGARAHQTTAEGPRGVGDNVYDQTRVFLQASTYEGFGFTAIRNRVSLWSNTLAVNGGR